MVQKSKSKSIEKMIYFSDFIDEEYFSEIINGEYEIFDKEEIIENIKKKGVGKDTLNYMTGLEISKSIIKLIRNKKIKHVIYLLYSSHPKNVMDSINNNILPKLNISVTLNFSVITNDVDMKEYKYKKKRYSNIYIRKSSVDGITKTNNANIAPKQKGD